MWKYGPGNAVGGIDMPVLTCNDVLADWKQNPFKLYTDSDSSRCGSYPRPRVPNACQDACKAQYDNCVANYAQGCKSYNHKRASFFEWAAEAKTSPVRRSVFGDSYSTATMRCSAQYGDCLKQNGNVNANSKCQSFGSGW